MNEWSQAFLGVIAVATALMAVVQIGAIVVAGARGGAGAGDHRDHPERHPAR